MNFIFHALTPINKAKGELLDVLHEKYTVADDVYKKIESLLSEFFSPLKKNLFVLIEHPYVDKVYRDSYYTYFSTKYKDYHRDCIRVSFFSSGIKGAAFFETTDNKLLQDNFRGYLILRPTFPDIIGRNLIDKRAFSNNNFITCKHHESVIVWGKRLQIEGFPHSSQDEESITCAETTIWALMEYFGHKYAEYKPVLPSVIIKKLNEHSDKRMLPSNGLTNDQISYALKDFGFGTMTYTKEDDKKDFLPNLSVYIESGFPIITILQNNKAEYNHAILMIGREKINSIALVNALKSRKNKIIPFSSLIKNYIVQDDNLHPYANIPLQKPGINYSGAEANYKITTFIVPLYKKMYMEVQRARKFFEAIFRDSRYGIRTSQKHIFRMYMASSRSFKEHLGNQNSLDNSLKFHLLAVSMPRFIWCAEYINPKDAAKGEVSSLIVLDATEGGEIWQDSFIFAAHKKFSLFNEAEDHTYKLKSLYVSFNGFKMYEHNLN